MISNLRSSENAPVSDGCSEWGRYWQAIGSFYWDDSETVFLGLLTIYVSMLYLPTFSESNAWDFRLVMTEISVNVPATSGDFRQISEDFRTLPKIKCPQMFPKTFEHFRSYLKDDTFSLLWYDFNNYFQFRWIVALEIFTSPLCGEPLFTSISKNNC